MLHWQLLFSICYLAFPVTCLWIQLSIAAHNIILLIYQSLFLQTVLTSVTHLGKKTFAFIKKKKYIYIYIYVHDIYIYIFMIYIHILNYQKMIPNTIK